MQSRGSTRALTMALVMATGLTAAGCKKSAVEDDRFVKIKNGCLCRLLAA